MAVGRATEVFWPSVRGAVLNPTTGESWEPQTNHDLAALVTLAAAGVGATNGADQRNVNHRGVQVVVDITAITGTGPTLTVKLQGKDAASGKYYDLLTSAALAATGTTLLTLYPGAPSTANVSIPQVLPATWRVIATVGGTGPAVTATVGASMII